MPLALTAPSVTIDDMRKKPETASFAIRLPKVAIAELDAIADAKFETRAGMAARIILDWLEVQRRQSPPKSKAPKH